MITFNAVLADAGISPSQVRLVRHQARGPSGITPFLLWKTRYVDFCFYQSFQTIGKFSVGDYLASFVVSPENETLFAGLYHILGCSDPLEAIHCPVTLKNFGPEGFEIYDLHKQEIMLDYEGRLAIDWGAGFLAWSQRAQNRNKLVEAIHRKLPDPPFPGLHRINLKTDNINLVPTSWQIPLSAVGGVYLLVCDRTGEQYVGSAAGQNGFWGRWLGYANGGFGGNKRLIERGRSNYHVSVLDVAPLSATLSEVISLEGAWKDKLGARAHGLNAN